MIACSDAWWQWPVTFFTEIFGGFGSLLLTLALTPAVRPACAVLLSRTSSRERRMCAVE